jgi:hypothetical protein
MLEEQEPAGAPNDLESLWLPFTPNRTRRASHGAYGVTETDARGFSAPLRLVRMVPSPRIAGRGAR